MCHHYTLLTIAEFRIVIICNSEEAESHVVSELLKYKRDYVMFQKDKELADSLKCHFTSNDVTSSVDIDPEK